MIVKCGQCHKDIDYDKNEGLYWGVETYLCNECSRELTKGYAENRRVIVDEV